MNKIKMANVFEQKIYLFPFFKIQINMDMFLDLLKKEEQEELARLLTGLAHCHCSGKTTNVIFSNQFQSDSR